MKQVEQWIQESDTLIELLNIVAALDLPDCWISAGTIRNYIWNRLSSVDDINSKDVDVVYFDANTDHKKALEIESYLNKTYPKHIWEVRNQACMHQHNFIHEKPYHDTHDAISKYPETCTSIATRLKNSQLEIMAPHGLFDLKTFKIKPTPHFKQSEKYLSIYRKRIAQKNWQEKWPQLTIYDK